MKVLNCTPPFDSGKQSLIVMYCICDLDADGMGISIKPTFEVGNVSVVVAERNPRHSTHVEVGVQQKPHLIILPIVPVA